MTTTPTTKITERELARQQYLTLKKATFSAAVSTGPQELDPLQLGDHRMFFSREGYLDFLRNGEFARVLNDADEMVTTMTLGGQFCVTVVAKKNAVAAAGK